MSTKLVHKVQRVDDDDKETDNLQQQIQKINKIEKLTKREESERKSPDQEKEIEYKDLLNWITFA